MSNHRQSGFTLVELLITLTILGVIATFTIPKVLASQQNAKNTAIVKEAASILTGAHTQYQQSNTLNAATSEDKLIPYINYVSRDTSALFDDAPNETGIIQCDAGAGYCLRLHNGAILFVRSWISFSGTGTTNAIYFTVDPDGAASTIQAVNLFLYFNGRVTSQANISANTVSSDTSRNPAPNDPSYFQW